MNVVIIRDPRKISNQAYAYKSQWYQDWQAHRDVLLSQFRYKLMMLLYFIKNIKVIGEIPDFEPCWIDDTVNNSITINLLIWQFNLVCTKLYVIFSLQIVSSVWLYIF